MADPQLEHLEALELFITAYIREYLYAEFLNVPLGHTAVIATIGAVLATIEAEDQSPAAEEEESSPWQVYAIEHLRSFEAMGLLELRDEKPYIPVSLRPAVVLGFVLASKDTELFE